MSKTNPAKINLKLILLFIPVAYGSYLFHEFGHWLAGELLGNDMVMNLNNAAPLSGSYLHSGDGLLVSIGGPAFTILLALLALLVIEKYKSIYAYPLLFFQFFCRFFSLVFGGFSKQDEAAIALLSGVGTYSVAIVVLLVLLLIVWRASRVLGINLQVNSYFFTISTVMELMVIGTYKLMY